MKITLHLTAASDSRLRRLKASTGTSLSEVVRNALAVYEALQGADEVTVRKGGDVKTLIMP